MEAFEALAPELIDLTNSTPSTPKKRSAPEHEAITVPSCGQRVISKDNVPSKMNISHSTAVNTRELSGGRATDHSSRVHTSREAELKPGEILPHFPLPSTKVTSPDVFHPDFQARLPERTSILHLEKRQALKVEAAKAKPKTKPKAKKAAVPHALLWICTHGKGQSRSWKAKSLKVVGVYASKEEAEAKRHRVMSEHECHGHGDIIVGDTWEDEIDLEIRPVGEIDL